MTNGVSIVKSMLRESINNRINRDWYLNNPHLWADKILGRDLYERHLLEGAEWLGWQENQIAFLRDITNLTTPALRKLFAICNRGGSKTWLTAIGTACLIANYDRLRVSIISGSFDQASQCYEYLGDCFSETSLSDLVLGEVTMKRTRFKKGGIVRLLAASTKRTKAPRSDIIIIDEACEAKSEIIQTVLPQAITAVRMKVIILTTPDKIGHIVKTWWDNAKKLGFTKYHWNAYQCKWIPPENITEFYNLYDESTFKTQIMGEWASKTGAYFKYTDVQKALCNMSDLPPLNQIDRFSMGIDWGDVHPTVVLVLGLLGNVLRGSDTWYVYSVLTFTEADITRLREEKYPKMDKHDIIIEEILHQVKLYHYSRSLEVWSEDAPISRFPNRTLRRKLNNQFEIPLNTPTFSGKKAQVISNGVGTFEKGHIKIPRIFKRLIDELIKYHPKQVGDRILDEPEKIDDDHVDAYLWARWCVRPIERKITQIGEL